jgi:hypothetical protein
VLLASNCSTRWSGSSTVLYKPVKRLAQSHCGSRARLLVVGGETEPALLVHGGRWRRGRRLRHGLGPGWRVATSEREPAPGD